MRRFILIAAGISLAVAGCKKDEGGKGYSDDDLARYKSALPARSTLQARAPGASAAAFGAGDAVYPGFAVGVATNVNGMIGGTLDIIEYVASLPPTLYDSDDLEFWWGPIPDGDSALADDHWSLFIHDRIEDVDFDPNNDLRYEFAVIRGLGNDVANLTPIIYGAATPVEGTDYGLGVMIYDFDNNVLFEDTHNPGHGPLTQGRMATIFAKGPDQNDTTPPIADITFVVAAFRQFLPDDAPGGTLPYDVDYFWGNAADGVNDFDFLDFAFQADVHNDSVNTALEDLDIKVAFFNNGIGRAGVGISGGEVAPETGAIEECWDATLSQDYIQFVVTTNGGANQVVLATSGSEAACVWDDATFDGIPDMSDAPDLVALVDAIADAGIPSDLPEEND